MKQLMAGNEAAAEAAIRAGCRYYYGYPITPQNEIPAYMARRMPEVDGVFLQAESELAAINMVLGAASTGAKVMTSSSSPGISLKQEGISYIAGCELPAVIINMVRGGPGLGNIAPSQGDYFQSAKGGGHGDYRLIVYTPSTVQEIIEYTTLAFEVAGKYRNPVLILGDGWLGQMMEPVEFDDEDPNVSKIYKSSSSWALTGASNRDSRIVKSLNLVQDRLEEDNIRLMKKYDEIEKNEVKFSTYKLDDADIAFVAYGTAARICMEAIDELRDNGIKAGLFKNLTAWPFPYTQLNEVLKNVKFAVCVEMSGGQMVEDVFMAANGCVPVHFYGRLGGNGPKTTDLINIVKDYKENNLPSEDFLAGYHNGLWKKYSL